MTGKKKGPHDHFSKLANEARNKRGSARVKDWDTIVETAKREIYGLLKSAETDPQLSLFYLRDFAELLVDIRKPGLAEMVLDAMKKMFRAQLAKTPGDSIVWQDYEWVIDDYTNAGLYQKALETIRELVSHLEGFYVREWTEEEKEVWKRHEKDDWKKTTTPEEQQWCKDHGDEEIARGLVEILKEKQLKIQQKLNDHAELERALVGLIERFSDGQYSH